MASNRYDVKDKLIIIDRDYVFRIVWFLAEEGDHGAELGDSEYTTQQLATARPEDRDHIAATIAAAKSKGVQRANGCHEGWTQ